MTQAHITEVLYRRYGYKPHEEVDASVLRHMNILALVPLPEKEQPVG